MYTKQIAENPYIHLLVRDDRYRKRTLLDEQTLLGSVALRAVLEVIERDEPNAPHQYAFVDPENSDAQQAFKRSRFEPRDPKVPPDRERSRDLLFVRDSGELPPAPEGYPPVLPSYRP